MHIRSATNPPNKKIAKLRRCSPAFQQVYAPRVSCVPFNMGSKNVRRCCALLKSLGLRPTWIVTTYPSRSWTDILSRSPPKAISDSESCEHLLNKLTEFKKNGCKMLVIEYGPIVNCRISPVWDLFINLGEMERILGIRVKIQGILPPGEQDPNSITKTRQYCKHHINYSSKVCYIQHKTVINSILTIPWRLLWQRALDHPMAYQPCNMSISI